MSEISSKSSSGRGEQTGRLRKRDDPARDRRDLKHETRAFRSLGAVWSITNRKPIQTLTLRVFELPALIMHHVWVLWWWWRRITVTSGHPASILGTKLQSTSGCLQANIWHSLLTGFNYQRVGGVKECFCVVCSFSVSVTVWVSQTAWTHFSANK